MKKLIYLAAAFVAISCCSNNPTGKDCKCLICEASDSLDYYAVVDAETCDSTWLYPHSENFNKWYDSLTTLLVEDIDNMPLDSIESYSKDLKESISFMACLNTGFDGLCDFYAYPKRFGNNAVKVLDINTDWPSYWVRSDIQEDWELFQTKVDTLIYYLYEKD